MKKIKRMLALLVAMVMVMGMTVTASAAEAKIIVDNLDENATITSVQVIAPDTTKPSGWTFVNGVEKAYANAFDKSTSENDLQSIIWSLILYKDGGAKVPEGTVAATAGQIQKALENVTGHSSDNVSGNVVTVNSAGVYAIKATTTNTKVYVYSPMAAYVAFKDYDTETGVPGGLEDTTINAKKTTLNIEKDSNEADDVVEVGKEVEYTIKTTVPYIKDAVNQVKYTLTDKISGAEYKLTVAEKLDATVTLAGVPITNLDFVVSKDSFTVDLSSIAANRENANKELVITYKATVTGIKVDNEVTMDDGDHTWNDTDTLYTGSIEMTKTGEEGKKLAGAVFKVYRTSDNKFAVATKTEDKDEYVVTDWTDKEEEATEVVTGKKGTFVVKGLDDSVTYMFKEVQAPDGYSINTNDSKGVWDKESKPEDKNGSASMIDTKLSSLPETGGIGTTIFTIGGCVIMIAAAGLFFASRRKSAK